MALSLNNSILQLKLKKRFGDLYRRFIQAIYIVTSLKHLFLEKALKNDSTIDREIENELNLISLGI